MESQGVYMSYVKYQEGGGCGDEYESTKTWTKQKRLFHI